MEGLLDIEENRRIRLCLLKTLLDFVYYSLAVTFLGGRMTLSEFELDSNWSFIGIVSSLRPSKSRSKCLEMMGNRFIGV